MHLNSIAPADHRPLTILRPKEAARHVAVGLSTLYRWELDPNMGFPQRVRLGANSSGWLLRELDDWLTSRMADRIRTIKEVV